MADNKKLTTAEILALARQQNSGGGADSSGDAAESNDAPETSQAPAPTEEKKPAAAPKSTADILAAARAQGGGGQEPAAEKPKPAAKPGSTADILAAARAQGGGAQGGGAAKPKPAAAAPKSTADILAAARAGGGSAAKGAPAASKPKTKKAAAAPVGDHPALKDMVAAVREAQVAGGPARQKVSTGGSSPAKPKLPGKKEKIARRGFVAVVAAVALTPFALAWSSVSAIAAIWSLEIARFMMPNMVLELPSKFKVGPPSDFPPGTVSAKFKAARGVWIVNTDEYDGRGVIFALVSICTHLGCTPNWLEGEQKFKCPCHGSGFYITGINFEGPAPRPLERAGLSVADDGMLEVDKSLKFQEELGQWSDPKSYELA